ncbi:hypothetical protein I204_01409 [Kwoniella mangroviensis CBS 8886]|nr:hypothetical protein I204_01409 [Kwoniella mangroviensis CBS 8886]
MPFSRYGESRFGNGARRSHNYNSFFARPARSTRYDPHTIVENFSRFFTDRYGQGRDEEGRTLQESLTQLHRLIQAGRIHPGILEEASRSDFLNGSRRAPPELSSPPAPGGAQRRRHTFEGPTPTEGPGERHQAPFPTNDEYYDNQDYSDDDYGDFDNDNYDYDSEEGPPPHTFRRNVTNPSREPVRSATWSFGIGPESSVNPGLDGSIRITPSMISNGQFFQQGDSHRHHVNLPPGFGDGYGQSRPFAGRGYMRAANNPRYFGGG